MTAPMFKNCPRCNHPADLAAPQCAKCGHAYRTRFAAPTDEPPTQAFPQPFHVPPAVPLQRPDNRKKIAAAAVCFFLAICLVLAGNWFMEQGHKADAEASRPNVPPETPVRITWTSARGGGLSGTFENTTGRPLKNVNVVAWHEVSDDRNGFVVGSHPEQDLLPTPIVVKEEHLGAEPTFRSVIAPGEKVPFLVLGLNQDTYGQIRVFTVTPTPDGKFQEQDIPFAVTIQPD